MQHSYGYDAAAFVEAFRKKHQILWVNAKVLGGRITKTQRDVLATIEGDPVFLHCLVHLKKKARGYEPIHTDVAMDESPEPLVEYAQALARKNGFTGEMQGEAGHSFYDAVSTLRFDEDVWIIVRRTPTEIRNNERGAKRGKGKPPLSDTEETVSLNLTMTASDRDWCKSQAGGATAYIRSLINADRKAR